MTPGDPEGRLRPLSGTDENSVGPYGAHANQVLSQEQLGLLAAPLAHSSRSHDDPDLVDLADSVRSLDASAPAFETEGDPRIPPKQNFFKIGEVAGIVGVKPYVLRYWEMEFSWIRPEKTKTRQRRYRRKDVALFLQIHRLRHEESLTISQTREAIRGVRSDTRNTRYAEVSARPSPAVLGAEGSRMRTHLVDLKRSVLDLMEVVDR